MYTTTQLYQHGEPNRRARRAVNRIHKHFETARGAANRYFWLYQQHVNRRNRRAAAHTQAERLMALEQLWYA
jgi:hypothetical protein